MKMKMGLKVECVMEFTIFDSIVLSKERINMNERVNECCY